jgi:hypothetical protein
LINIQVMDHTARGPRKFQQRFYLYSATDALKKGSNNPNDKFAHFAQKCTNIELLDLNNKLYNKVFPLKPPRPVLSREFQHHSFLFMDDKVLKEDAGNEDEEPLENVLTLSESLKETGEEFIKRRNMIPLAYLFDKTSKLW